MGTRRTFIVTVPEPKSWREGQPRGLLGDAVPVRSQRPVREQVPMVPMTPIVPTTPRKRSGCVLLSCRGIRLA